MHLNYLGWEKQSSWGRRSDSGGEERKRIRIGGGWTDRKSEGYWDRTAVFSLTEARLRLASLDLFTCTFSRDQSELCDGPPRQRNDTATSSLRRRVRETRLPTLTAIVRHTWRSGDPRTGIRRQPRTTAARKFLPLINPKGVRLGLNFFFFGPWNVLSTNCCIAACLKAPAASLRHRPRHHTRLSDSPPPSLKRSTTRRCLHPARNKTSRRWIVQVAGSSFYTTQLRSTQYNPWWISRIVLWGFFLCFCFNANPKDLDVNYPNPTCLVNCWQITIPPVGVSSSTFCC